MKITITYKRLLDTAAALDKVGKIKGLPAADKMLFARTRRALAGDLDDINGEVAKVGQRYRDQGFERQKKEILDRVEAMPEGEARTKAIASARKAVESLSLPTQVLHPELGAFQKEYDELIKEEVEIEITQLPLSKIVNDETILPEDIFALDWLFTDDVTAAPAEKPAQSPAPNGGQP